MKAGRVPPREKKSMQLPLESGQELYFFSPVLRTGSTCSMFTEFHPLIPKQAPSSSPGADVVATQSSARKATAPVLAQKTAVRQHKARAYLKHFFVHCVLAIFSAKLLTQHLQLPPKLDHSLCSSMVPSTELPLGAAVF